MNENINLIKILIDCPIGTKLYCPIYGTVNFKGIEKHGIVGHLIKCEDPLTCRIINVTSDGKLYNATNGECILFPSKEQRDWSKFWTSIEKFNPENFKPFDKVLTRDFNNQEWRADFFSHLNKSNGQFCLKCTSGIWKMCIPYNAQTQHLVGTDKDCPEYYKWWENN